MSIPNVVRLSQIKKFSLPDYAHVNKVSKNEKNKRELMSHNMMIGYEVYDRFTMEHFTLRQRMTLTIKIYC
jgi:hypothetical protein